MESIDTCFEDRRGKGNMEKRWNYRNHWWTRQRSASEGILGEMPGVSTLVGTSVECGQRERASGPLQEGEEGSKG